MCSQPVQINPMHIGKLKVDFPVILSPMAGYTDSAFRSLCMDHHCGMTYTEVINAQAVVHGSKRTMHMLEAGENEHPVAGHIYGTDPEVMAAAASIIEKMNLYHTIDINCGCPVRKIVAKGAGAALMHDPEKIKSIVSAVSGSISLPVTIKTRIGPSPDLVNILEILRAVEEGGAAAIAVHARFTSKKHSGPADWEMLAMIKTESRIPVIGNGGIKNAGDVIDMFRRTNVDGVMIGRAAIGNPWIFDEVFCMAENFEYIPHSREEHSRVIIEHLDRMIAFKNEHRKFSRKGSFRPDQAAALHFRSHLFRYLSGFHGWNSLKRSLNSINCREAVVEAVNNIILQ